MYSRALQENGPSRPQWPTHWNETRSSIPAWRTQYLCGEHNTFIAHGKIHSRPCSAMMMTKTDPLSDSLHSSTSFLSPGDHWRVFSLYSKNKIQQMFLSFILHLSQLFPSFPRTRVSIHIVFGLHGMKEKTEFFR
ncbi:hypothetical protein Mapa_004915 [Marchantia paleacea]|nr:hypothetical protein Mapa_004915 [Marchantia paleacea]